MAHWSVGCRGQPALRKPETPLGCRLCEGWNVTGWHMPVLVSRCHSCLELYEVTSSTEPSLRALPDTELEPSPWQPPHAKYTDKGHSYTTIFECRLNLLTLFCTRRSLALAKAGRSTTRPALVHSMAPPKKHVTYPLQLTTINMNPTKQIAPAYTPPTKSQGSIPGPDSYKSNQSTRAAGAAWAKDLKT